MILLKNNTIDAHDWMSRLRIPPYTVAAMRKFRVGDFYQIGYFEGPGIIDGRTGCCMASIERVRGGFRYYGMFNISCGKPTRPHILTSGGFALHIGNVIEFTLAGLVAERLFAKVCRYISYFERNYGIEEPSSRDDHI